MLTLADVLASEPVRRGRPEVLSGAPHLGAPVRWVHVSDLPDVAHLVDGGELLLTTGGFLHAPDAVAELDRLVDLGAVGVVVELGDRPLPADVIERARDREWPVVALHGFVRFVEITTLVHRALVADQLAEVGFAEQVHSTFTALALRRADRSRVVDAAAGLLEAPVVLEDQRRRVLAVGGPSPGLLDDWERRSRLATWRGGTAVVGPDAWTTTVVGVQGRVWARLVAPTAGSGPDQRSGVVLERAAQALELGRMIERDDAATEERLHGSFLADLLAGRLDDETQALARLRAIGVAPGPTYTGLVARGDQGVVRHLLRRAPALVIDLGQGRTGVLLVGCPPPSLGSREPDDLVLAAGPEVDRLVDVPASLRAARWVADAALGLPAASRPGLVTHADVRLHGLLASIGGTPTLETSLDTFVEAELGRVLEHDARHGSDLLGLLRSYLDAGGNVTTLARATHRNRTSLYPALDRLERVLGHPLAPASSRTSLSVALLAHDLGRA